jgi:nucleotide-binding universal stress UspA family protein
MSPFEAACQPLACHRHVYKDLSIDEGVRSFSKEIKADLVAISNHERHPIKRMLIGSNVELLINHSELPVLTIDYH